MTSAIIASIAADYPYIKIPSKLEVAPHALKMCEWVMGDTP